MNFGHLFLGQEITIFGREGGAKQTLTYQLMLALPSLVRKVHVIQVKRYINRDAHLAGENLAEKVMSFSILNLSITM